MTTVKRIIKNTVFLMIMQLITMSLGLIFTALIARNLGVIAFGKYAFALAFTSLFAIIIDVGFNQLSIREISRDHLNVNKYIGNIIPLKIIFSGLFLLMIGISINLMKYPYDTKMIVYIFAIYAILTSFGELFKSIFNSFELMEYTSFITIIEKIIIVGVGLLLLYLGYGIIEIILVYLIAGIINIILCLKILSKTKIYFKINFQLNFWKYLVISAAPFGVFCMFMTINNRIDTVMLSSMKGDSAVGWYNAAYTLVTALKFIPSSFIGALFPIFSKLSTESNDSLKFAYEKSLKYLMILAIPIAFGTIILADEIVILVYGDNFTNSVIALQILILAIVPIFIHNGLGSIILVLNKEKKAVYMWFMCAILNVTLNYFLIPIYGLFGACVTTLISEIFLCIQFNYFVSKQFHSISIKSLFYKPLVGSLVMALFLQLLTYTQEVNLFMLICLASVSYFITLYSIKGFDNEDIILLKKAISGSV